MAYACSSSSLIAAMGKQIKAKPMPSAPRWVTGSTNWPSTSSAPPHLPQLSGPVVPSIPPALATAGPPSRSGPVLSFNSLSGAIPPAQFGKLAAQKDASYFTPLFGRVKPAQVIDLPCKALKLDLTGGVELPEQLISVNVSHNMIYGGVPAQASCSCST
ncbi:hypothetical protein ABZP36_030792 [Zizania latifolia]